MSKPISTRPRKGIYYLVTIASRGKVYTTELEIQQQIEATRSAFFKGIWEPEENWEIGKTCRLHWHGLILFNGNYAPLLKKINTNRIFTHFKPLTLHFLNEARKYITKDIRQGMTKDDILMLNYYYHHYGFDD